MGLQQRWRTELGPLGLSLELLIDRREVASALIDQSGAEHREWSLLVLSMPGEQPRPFRLRYTVYSRRRCRLSHTHQTSLREQDYSPATRLGPSLNNSKRDCRHHFRHRHFFRLFFGTTVGQPGRMSLSMRQPTLLRSSYGPAFALWVA